MLQHWLYISNPGAKPSYDYPYEFLEAFYAYVRATADSPIEEPLTFCGKLTGHNLPHPRALTREGAYVSMGISKAKWYEYKHDPLFSDVVEHCENIIDANMLDGSLAGVYNANIASRVLRLRDLKDHTSSDGSMSPSQQFADACAEDEDDDD